MKQNTTHFLRSPARSTISILLCIASLSATAIERDGVSIGAGGFYSNINSGISSTIVGRDNSQSGRISFESDLNMEETSAQPIAKVQWDFKQRHHISLNYFNLDRKGSTFKVADFIIGDKTFKASAKLNSKLNLEFWQIKYGYAFYQTEVSEWGLTGGLHLINLDIGFNGTIATDINDGLSTDVGDDSTGFSSPVPLPNIGTYYNYKFANDFIVHLNAQYFDISVDSLDASMFSLEGGVEYYPTPNISLYTGLSYYNVKATYIQDIRRNLDINWDVKLKYWGPSIALNYHF